MQCYTNSNCFWGRSGSVAVRSRRNFLPSRNDCKRCATFFRRLILALLLRVSGNINIQTNAGTSEISPRTFNAISTPKSCARVAPMTLLNVQPRHINAVTIPRRSENLPVPLLKSLVMRIYSVPKIPAPIASKSWVETMRTLQICRPRAEATRSSSVVRVERTKQRTGREKRQIKNSFLRPQRGE